VDEKSGAGHYPDKAGGNWPDKIETIRKHIAQAREIVAND